MKHIDLFVHILDLIDVDWSWVQLLVVSMCQDVFSGTMFAGCLGNKKALVALGSKAHFLELFIHLTWFL